MGVFPRAQERVRNSVVNEPSVFEPLKFYCIYIYIYYIYIERERERERETVGIYGIKINYHEMTYFPKFAV